MRELRSSTVAEVREMLEGYADDTPVVFVCSYGDRGHTQQALSIQEADLGRLEESGYSNSGWALDEGDRDDDDTDDDADDDRTEYVILRGGGR